MGYYSRHAIFLKDNDRQKLELIRQLLAEEDIAFLIRRQTVYLEDGEALKVPCVSDVNWNCGGGYGWYDFQYDMERVSEKFNEQYPDEEILVYEKTEDGYETLYTFLNGEQCFDDNVIHYRREMERVCKSLNKRMAGYRLPFFKVVSIVRHPTVVFHDGAYTFIGYNVYELYGDYRQYSIEPPSFGDGCRNYNSLPDRIKALQILNSYLEDLRQNGGLAAVALSWPRR